jgi:hypothetical protein
MKTTWSIVVIYDAPAGREQAMHACDHLVQRFWAESELEVTWWSSAMLERSEMAGKAVEKAIGADLVIFALEPEEELPLCLKDWIETWLSRRGDREGALVDLMSRDTEAINVAGERQMYLRHAAHRGGMDYLTREPQNISWSFPDSLDSVTTRAERVTRVLDEILHTH